MSSIQDKGRSVYELAPGFGLAVAIAGTAAFGTSFIAKIVPIPTILIALVLGIICNKVAEREYFRVGITFCVKTLLRWAVSLLGLRIALGEIIALGLSTAVLIVVAMIATILSGFIFARLLGQNRAYGALAGAGTAICGASATLATATVLPDYRGKAADITFVVIAVNALSTLAMVLYPPFCRWLNLDEQTTGVLLGGTIHDVAQVVGAGYSVSDTVGNAAVIVKLFRVFLLLPMVVGIGLWTSREANAAKVPVPIFAIMFLVLCIINSIASSISSFAPFYTVVKSVLIDVSNWGLLIAISALGLGTSLSAMAALGWRHVATVVGTTVIILAVVSAGLLILS